MLGFLTANESVMAEYGHVRDTELIHGLQHGGHVIADGGGWRGKVGLPKSGGIRGEHKELAVKLLHQSFVHQG